MLKTTTGKNAIATPVADQDSSFARAAAEAENSHPRGNVMSKFRGELRTPEEWEAALLRGDATIPGWTVTPNEITTAMPRSDRKHIVAPPDHWTAFQAAADKAEMSLSEWVGVSCLKNLPASVRKGLSERRKPGQPRKTPAKGT